MLFMNEHEIHDAAQRYRDHPILAPATMTLRALADWTNRNSDGWCYWPKPCRAAKQLQELVGTLRTYFDDPAREDVTLDDLKRAYRPIRAFSTREGADFPIYLPELVA
jgi:hypothetical protein